METKKIVLLGQFGVGKSSLMRRFIEDKFEHNYQPTLGVQIKKKVLQLPSGKELNMIIWDLEGFSSVSKTRASYLLGSNGLIYVVDLTRPVTYETLAVELAFIATKYPKVHLELIGNKVDVQDPEPIQTLLATQGIIFNQFVSAKTGEGVPEVFANLSLKMISHA